MAAEPRQRRRMLFGLLIIIALLVGSLLIFFVDDLQTSFENNYTINIVLPGATGLAPESPVWLSGREMGRIASLGLLPAGSDTLARVHVVVELPTSVRSQVREDSEVRLTSIGPMSERVIDISAGSAAASALQPGDTLYHTPQLSPAQLTARSAIVRADLSEAMIELGALVPAVRARLEDTERAFAGLEAVMGEAAQLQSDMDANPGMALIRDPSFAASLRATRAHAAELPLMIGRLRDTSGPPAEVRAALSRLQVRADSLRAQLAAAEGMLNNPNGTLARMQQDSAIARAVRNARMELDSLMADIRRNPLRYGF